jgi:hypothetical protein
MQWSETEVRDCIEVGPAGHQNHDDIQVQLGCVMQRSEPGLGSCVDEICSMDTRQAEKQSSSNGKPGPDG